MRYPPEQAERLAAEYVLGTLDGPARRRFETLMHLRADVRHAVWYWENALHGVAAGLRPVRPPRAVWRGVRRRIRARGRPAAALSRWRLRFAGVTALVAAAAFWLGTQYVPAPPQPERVAVFADDSAQPLWVISADADEATLVAESSGVPAAGDDRVYELWALPAGGEPRSLGVLNTDPGRYETPLTPALMAAVEQSMSLAISLEPPGGSPTGAPTGPVIHQASLIRL